MKEGKSRRSGIFGRRQDGEPEVARAPEQAPEPAREGNGRAGWPEFWSEDSARGAQETRTVSTAPADTAARPDTAPPPDTSEQVTAEQPPVAATAPPQSATQPDPRPAPEGPRGPALPRTVGPMESFVRHPILTIVPILLAVGAGVFIGLERSPEYTAKSRIQVGRTDVPAYVLQNVVGGNQALAAAYARVIATTPVVTKAARAAGISASEVRSRVDATPIPGSTLIQIEAKGSSKRGSIVLANESARSLISYVSDVSRDTRGRQAFKRFRQARAEVIRLQRRAGALSRKVPLPTKALSSTLVDLDGAKLRASNLSNIYRSISADPTSGSPLRLIAPAATASSDRRQVLEQLILIGLAAGVVVGLAIALLVANRGRLRAMRE